jgi:hypothetical protein
MYIVWILIPVAPDGKCLRLIDCLTMNWPTHNFTRTKTKLSRSKSTKNTLHVQKILHRYNVVMQKHRGQKCNVDVHPPYTTHTSNISNSMHCLSPIYCTCGELMALLAAETVRLTSARASKMVASSSSSSLEGSSSGFIGSSASF